jgi:spermidine synthase
MSVPDSRPSLQPSPGVGPLWLVAFFLSGAVALVYQVLWTRQLGLVFGVTIQAVSTVLACFMGGLALGSYVAGRWSDRLRRPLRAFAWMEVAIAIAAFATPLALSAADALFVSLTPTLESRPALTTLVRIALSTLVLIVPATLMGTTYPLVLRAAGQSADGIRRHASLLYAVNTTGAVAGVLFGSLWLVPTLGMRLTLIVGAGLNLTVAALAFYASRHEAVNRSTADEISRESPATSHHADTAPLTPAVRMLVLLIITASGAVTLALEIIWFRILVFFLRPTTYAFASMLAAVLIGLAVGSYLVTPWLRRRANWLAILGGTEILIGVLGLVSTTGLVRAHDVMRWLLNTLEPLPYGFVIPLMAAAAVAILPTAVLLGAAFPIGLVLWTTGVPDQSQRLGRRVGTLYALNVAGAIVGSLLAGFVLIPAFGAQQSLILVTAVPVMGGLALLWFATPRWRWPALLATPAVVAALAMNLPDVFADVITRRYPGHEVLWHAEDAQASVDVVRFENTRALLIDGMRHASDGAGMAGYHRAIGTLAVAVHPDPKQVLIVGLGGGSTAGGASILPNATTMVVELSPSVIDAAPWFEAINLGLLGNPNVRFRVADARHYLRTTSIRYDVITADLMESHLAGAGNLYSSDYYELARRALAPGGIMVQWIGARTEYQHKLMVRSFLSVFPHVTSWQRGGILIGSQEPFLLRPEDFARKTAYPAVKEAFDKVGLTSFEQLLDSYFSGDKELRAYAGDGPLLRDDKPVIEYFLSMPQDSPPPDMSPFAGRATDIVARDRR